MVVRAEQDAVVEVGGTTLQPRDPVVDLGPGARDVAPLRSAGRGGARAEDGGRAELRRQRLERDRHDR